MKMDNKTLELAKLLADKYPSIVYFQNLATSAIGGIYLPISKGNAKKEAQKLEIIIEDFIEKNKNLGRISAVIVPTKNKLELNHPKNFIKNLSDGFNHIQQNRDASVKDVISGKDVEWLDFHSKFMPRTTIFQKDPQYRIPGKQVIIQTDKMDKKGNQKFVKINGQKRKIEESWSDNKYFYLFISEIGG